MPVAPTVQPLSPEAVQQTEAVDPTVATTPSDPQFQAGSEIDEMDQMEATKGTKRLQTHSKTDTGLAIPL
jgi:hypothetical protein